MEEKGYLIVTDGNGHKVEIPKAGLEQYKKILAENLKTVKSMENPTEYDFNLCKIAKIEEA